MNKKEMLESVRGYLANFGSVDERIIDAMDKVDRVKFYPFRLEAYEDSAQPIEKGQTISQPSCVGRMLSLLDLKEGDYVLEVGAGSGWFASLLSYLVKPGKVLSLDVHDELVEVARKNSSDFGLDNNLRIENQNFLDLVETFDKIVFSCGIRKEDEDKISGWVEKHLNDGGRAVVPYEKGSLIIYSKDGVEISKDYTEEKYCFVPLFM
jgi:protein-L-isoaspartate(D-aspartate) O-methyltransferase